MASRESFYVAVARAKYDLQIDAAELAELRRLARVCQLILKIWGEPTPIGLQVAVPRPKTGWIMTRC
jgi:ATP-dependent exoDNAse (exonuclease V) alpha subunit